MNIRKAQAPPAGKGGRAPRPHLETAVCDGSEATGRGHLGLFFIKDACRQGGVLRPLPLLQWGGECTRRSRGGTSARRPLPRRWERHPPRSCTMSCHCRGGMRAAWGRAALLPPFHQCAVVVVAASGGLVDPLPPPVDAPLDGEPLSHPFHFQLVVAVYMLWHENDETSEAHTNDG